jgi:hypothetical protein
MASATGTARIPTQGSWRPLVTTLVGSPVLVIDLRELKIEEVGFTANLSTGQDIIARFAVKPTSSILSSRKSITKTGEPTKVVTKGRHDPCVGIRAVPVAEAMIACVILDHFLVNRGQIGNAGGRIG